MGGEQKVERKMSILLVQSQFCGQVYPGEFFYLGHKFFLILYPCSEASQ